MLNRHSAPVYLSSDHFHTRLVLCTCENIGFVVVLKELLEILDDFLYWCSLFTIVIHFA